MVAVADVVVETPEAFLQMPDEYRTVATRQMVVHTEGELSGADDYIQVFYPMAPNAAERKVCCERAAEEFRHYELGRAVLAAVGVGTEEMENTALLDRENFAAPGLHQMTTWAERGVFSMLGEDAVMEHLTEMAESSYRPWAATFEEIIRDEKVHIAHGGRVVRELLRQPDGHDQVQAAVDRLWPYFVGVFGHEASWRSDVALRWGLRRRSNAQARDDWLARIVPQIERLGLRAPS